MLRSVLDTSVADVLVRLDDDDIGSDPLSDQEFGPQVRWIRGAPVPPGEKVNQLASVLGYDAYLWVTDDMTFVRSGWEPQVLEAISRFPRRIGVVHLQADVDVPYANWICVSREWLDAVGWFAWPGCGYFCSDTILQSLGEALDRIVRIEPQVVAHKALQRPDSEQRLVADERALRMFYGHDFGRTLARLRRTIQ